jgi:glycosyltransferase involved in cell wall biosynthesis
LYFDISGQGGGSNISLRTLIDDLDAKRYEAVLALGTQPSKKVWGDRPAHVLSSAGFDNYDFFPARWSLPWIYHFLRWIIHLPWDALQSWLLLRKVRPDIVHVNVGQALVFGMMARLSGYPVVWHVRELVCRNMAGKFQISIYKKCSHRIIAISNAVARRLGGGSNVISLPNPVTISATNSTPTPTLSREDHHLKILLLGKPSKVKGFEFLSRVSEKLSHRRDIIFQLGGDFSDPPAGMLHRILRTLYRRIKNTAGEREELRNTWIKAVEDKRAEILGVVIPEQAIARCDVVVCPNIVTEPFGRTVIEAYAQGRPVIATDVEAFDETIEHGRSGWLLPLDADTWAAHMEHLADHRDEIQSTKPYVLELARRYAATGHADAIMNVYDSLLKDFTAGSIPP